MVVPSWLLVECKRLALLQLVFATEESRPVFGFYTFDFIRPISEGYVPVAPVGETVRGGGRFHHPTCKDRQRVLQHPHDNISGLSISPFVHWSLDGSTFLRRSVAVCIFRHGHEPATSRIPYAFVSSALFPKRPINICDADLMSENHTVRGQPQTCSTGLCQ